MIFNFYCNLNFLNFFHRNIFPTILIKIKKNFKIILDTKLCNFFPFFNYNTCST